MRPRGCCAWLTIPPGLQQRNPRCGEAARWLDAALEALDPDGAGSEEGEVIEARAVVLVVSQLRPLLNGLLLVLALAVQPGSADGNRTTVLSIGDGDTIRMQQGQQRITVRLASNRCAEA